MLIDEFADLVGDDELEVHDEGHAPRRRALDVFLNRTLSKPDTVQLVLVPEPIADDLKAHGTSLEALLQYDKAIAHCGRSGLKDLVILNSLSDSGMRNLAENKELFDLANMSEKLAPLMGVALDIRRAWLATGKIDELLIEEFIELPDNEAAYPFDQYRFDVQNTLAKVVKGIHDAAPRLLKDAQTLSDTVVASYDGRVVFVIVPYGYDASNTDFSDETMTAYYAAVCRAIVRKASVYQTEKALAVTKVYSNYLDCLKNNLVTTGR